MTVPRPKLRRASARFFAVCLLAVIVIATRAQQPATDARDWNQPQDETFATLYKGWTGDAKYGSPLVDHLPIVKGVPTPKDVLGYHIGAPRTLTHYANILRYYRALAAATPRVRVESVGRSDEGRELVVVWVTSEQNMKGLQANRDRLAKLADPRGLSEPEIRRLIASTKPDYHVIGGLHSGETGPSEMLMELVYRLATETSPIVTRIRDNVYVSVTPVADPDGRDRYVDWFYRGLETTAGTEAGAARGAQAGTTRSGQEAGGARAGQAAEARAAEGGGERAGVQAGAQAGGQRGGEPGSQGGQRGGATMAVPYWGKYVFHDNNRDINLSLTISRALMDWFLTAHPPVMHDLHESMALMYTYSGGPPQNPNLDPLLFAELPWFSNWELAQMTKWGMPGVYTHAFMDGWSPGYYASVAYNHNALMKMYETQSGRDPVEAPASGTAPDLAPRGGAAAEGQRGGASTEGPRGGAAGQGQRSGTAPDGQRATEGQRGGTTAEGQRGAAPGQGQRAGTAAEGQRAAAPPEGMRGGPGAAVPLPTGRGGAQDREWYRGLPVPPNAAASFSRRANTNYMQTGVLSSLQLASQFPTTIVENFYVKSRNAIEDGRSKPPYGFVIPPQRDMTRVVELLKILRLQGIEVGQATAEFKLGDSTFPSGSYVIKRDQPYGRLAKNLLEKQLYPDTRLTTYDDSGWTMGLLMGVEVKEVSDAGVLKVTTTSVSKPALRGKVAGSGTAGLAVAHLGSNNMVTLRYRLRTTPVKVAEKGFTAEGVEFPPGSLVIEGAPATAARAAVEELGLTAAALQSLPTVPTHDAPAPRIAIYSQWTTTQDLGWYRLTFDNFGIPYDLIYREQVRKGDLRAKYDVIVMAAQNINRQAALQAPSARPQPYQKSEKYPSLGIYGETADMSGGVGQEGVDAFAKFLENGGTLIAAAAAARFPIEFGWAHTVDVEPITGVTAQRPIVQADVLRTDHPVFYGYTGSTMPVKYAGGFTLRAGVADQQNVLARYTGGDASVLSGAMVGADQLRQKAFAVDIPNAHQGKGRVVLFASNPIYRWQNHGEFNMIFNAIMNWNYVPR
jgi:hypothetical protein